MTTLPEQLSPRAASDCLAGGGEMGALMRSIDWAQTPLGPVERCAARTLASTALRSQAYWQPAPTII